MTPTLARLVEAAQDVSDGYWGLPATIYSYGDTDGNLMVALRDALAAVAQAGAEPSDAMKGYEKGLGVLRHELNAARAAIREAEEMIADQQLSAYWLDLFDIWKQHPAVQAALEENQ